MEYSIAVCLLNVIESIDEFDSQSMMFVQCFSKRMLQYVLPVIWSA